MAKRTTGLTEAKIAAYEKEGRGHGKGKDYKPWIIIQDFPSQGLSTRSKGWKTKRIHHFLSKLELNYFYALEWDSYVVDIREQFPLSRIDTLAIAEQKGISHPADPKTKIPIVMTTDFLITVKTASGYKKYARTIKPSKDLENLRTIEKFEIERSYWDQREIDWRIVTEKELPKNIIENVTWLHPSFFEIKDLSPSVLETYVNYMKSFIKQRNLSVVEVATEFDQEFHLEAGTGLEIIKYLIAHKELRVDIEQKIHTHLWVKDVFDLENM